MAMGVDHWSEINHTFYVFNKPPILRGSRGRKSKNAERTAQQENEDEIIARVIEERIEG